MSKSKQRASSSLKFTDKRLADVVPKEKIQDVESKEARDRITVLDHDTQDIKGFRDTDMIVEVSYPFWCLLTVSL
jgi:3-hydroxybutyryl-CoA dehydrogenase